MRIERIAASPHKKGRVLVFLEDGACLKITEQELLDFGLRAGDDLDDQRLGRLKEAAGVSSVKAAAADLIGKRAMSRRDLERKLREKGASEVEARYAAEWMEAIGAINDAEYAALLARHCADLGYGPARIREKLRETNGSINDFYKLLWGAVVVAGFIMIWLTSKDYYKEKEYNRNLMILDLCMVFSIFLLPNLLPFSKLVNIIVSNIISCLFIYTLNFKYWNERWK